MDAETAAERALSDFPFDMEWLSGCCGAPCLGHMEMPRPGFPAEGICSDCHEHAEFTQDEE